MSKKDEQKDEQGVCPHCGYCPHCGRANGAERAERIVYVPMPYPVPAAPHPQPYIAPYNPNPWWWPQVICDGGSLSVGELPGYANVTAWNGGGETS